VPDIATLVNLGAAGAVLIAIFMFLKYLHRAQMLDREERKSERMMLVDLIKNDLTHVSLALRETTGGLKEVKDGLREVVSTLKGR
jgi:hypothetical protein